ncbi:hypothetical protein CBM2599_B50303 [Cupriavidus taiwanensis]|nr:hypothetical protein CBM2599_B50303 [Cupriavidus taiwanensis]
MRFEVLQRPDVSFPYLRSAMEHHRHGVTLRSH